MDNRNCPPFYSTVGHSMKQFHHKFGGASVIHKDDDDSKCAYYDNDENSNPIFTTFSTTSSNPSDENKLSAFITTNHRTSNNTQQQNHQQHHSVGTHSLYQRQQLPLSSIDDDEISSGDATTRPSAVVPLRHTNPFKGTRPFFLNHSHQNSTSSAKNASFHSQFPSLPLYTVEVAAAGEPKEVQEQRQGGCSQSDSDTIPEIHYDATAANSTAAAPVDEMELTSLEGENTDPYDHLLECVAVMTEEMERLRDSIDWVRSDNAFLFESMTMAGDAMPNRLHEDMDSSSSSDDDDDDDSIKNTDDDDDSIKNTDDDDNNNSSNDDGASNLAIDSS